MIIGRYFEKPTASKLSIIRIILTRHDEITLKTAIQLWQIRALLQMVCPANQGTLTMSFQHKLKEEIRAIGIAGFYFGSWIAALLLFKSLILAEYKIDFHGWSLAVVGALVLSKVVLVLEHFSLGSWVRNRPAWVEVLLRTFIYALGVALVMIIEKGFEGRHQYGSFGQALQQLYQHRDVHHVWVNTLCISGALLGYNLPSVVRKHLGQGGLIRIFLSPLPTEKKTLETS